MGWMLDMWMLDIWIVLFCGADLYCRVSLLYRVSFEESHFKYNSFARSFHVAVLLL